MPLRNYLFVASLLVLFGCTAGDGNGQLELQKQLDSLIVAHTVELDSLNGQVQLLQEKIVALEAEKLRLEDSLAGLSGSSTNQADGPQPIPHGPEGDPTEVPIKRR